MESRQGKENQRVRLTKRLLRESLLSLLGEKPVERITVKELCAAAQLNRSTFYNYYQDVQGLYAEMASELVDALLEYVREMGERSEEILRAMLGHIRDRQEAFALLIYNGAHMDFTCPIQRRVLEGTIRYAQGAGRAMQIPEKQWRYALDYVFMGGDGAICHWVQRGCDLELAVLAQLLEEMIRASLEAASHLCGAEGGGAGAQDGPG